MPIFEFDCQECKNKFELLIGVGKTAASNGAGCPACGSKNMKKKFSTFSARSTGGGQTAAIGGSGCGSCSSSSCSTCGN